MYWLMAVSSSARSAFKTPRTFSLPFIQDLLRGYLVKCSTNDRSGTTSAAAESPAACLELGADGPHRLAPKGGWAHAGEQGDGGDQPQRLDHEDRSIGEGLSTADGQGSIVKPAATDRGHAIGKGLREGPGSHIQPDVSRGGHAHHHRHPAHV